MKNLVVLIALLFIFSCFSISDKSDDADNAMSALNGFYDAMSKFEYTKIDDYCTTEFGAIDQGKYFKNMGEFVDVVRTYEGATFKIELELIDSKIKSKSGLLIVMFDVDIKMDGQEMHIKALESYTMKKESGKWLIDFIHSSPVKE